MATSDNLSSGMIARLLTHMSGDYLYRVVERAGFEYLERASMWFSDPDNDDESWSVVCRVDDVYDNDDGELCAWPSRDPIE